MVLEPCTWVCFLKAMENIFNLLWIVYFQVHFDQFKEALILILSRTLSNEEHFQEPGKDANFSSFPFALKFVQGRIWGLWGMCVKASKYLPPPDWAVIWSDLSFDVVVKGVLSHTGKSSLPQQWIREEITGLFPGDLSDGVAITHSWNEQSGTEWSFFPPHCLWTWNNMNWGRILSERRVDNFI